jgi:DNA-binding MarR family transcriptional regulator
MNRPEDSAAPVTADNVMFSLLAAAHALEGQLDSALDRVGLSMSKLGVLTQLVQAGEPLALSQLAARLSCVRSNMTQLVDRLEAEGLVRRVDDPADRRSVLAAVTPLGESRQAEGARELGRIREAFAESMAPADRAALERVLGSLAEAHPGKA